MPFWALLVTGVHKHHRPKVLTAAIGALLLWPLFLVVNMIASVWPFFEDTIVRVERRSKLKGGGVEIKFDHAKPDTFDAAASGKRGVSFRHATRRWPGWAG